MLIKEETLGVKRIMNFYQLLKKELETADEITVDFTNVKNIDLSVVQVIVAAGRKARIEGKTIKLKSVSDSVINQMMICGLKL